MVWTDRHPGIGRRQVGRTRARRQTRKNIPFPPAAAIVADGDDISKSDGRAQFLPGRDQIARGLWIDGQGRFARVKGAGCGAAARRDRLRAADDGRSREVCRDGGRRRIRGAARQRQQCQRRGERPGAHAPIYQAGVRRSASRRGGAGAHCPIGCSRRAARPARRPAAAARGGSPGRHDSPSR